MKRIITLLVTLLLCGSAFGASSQGGTIPLGSAGDVPVSNGSGYTPSDTLDLLSVYSRGYDPAPFLRMTNFASQIADVSLYGGGSTTGRVSVASIGDSVGIAETSYIFPRLASIYGTRGIGMGNWGTGNGIFSGGILTNLVTGYYSP